jgi:hypothetical protein
MILRGGPFMAHFAKCAETSKRMELARSVPQESSLPLGTKGQLNPGEDAKSLRREPASGCHHARPMILRAVHSWHTSQSVPKPRSGWGSQDRFHRSLPLPLGTKGQLNPGEDAKSLRRESAPCCHPCQANDPAGAPFMAHFAKCAETSKTDGARKIVSNSSLRFRWELKGS